MLHNIVLYIAASVFVFWTVFLISERQTRESFWKQAGWQWCVSALLAGFVCLNQQVITGKTVWPGHFVQYTNPIGFIVFFTSLAFLSHGICMRYSYRVRMIYEQFFKYAAVVGIACLFVVQLIAVSSVQANQREYQDIQRYGPALEWLNANIEDDCVVFVAEKQERMEKFITAYTPCDLYQSSFVFYGVPYERILHNYLVHLRLFGVTNDTIGEYLDTHVGYYREHFFEDWVDKFGDGRDTWLFNTKPYAERMSFIPRTKEKIEAAYTAEANTSLQSLLTKYSIQYIMYDRTQDTLAPVVDVYETVYDANDIVIRKVQ